MMTDTEKKELNSQLNEAVIQLIQAQKYLRQDGFQQASIFIGNVQNFLPKLRQQLAKQR